MSWSFLRALGASLLLLTLGGCPSPPSPSPLTTPPPATPLPVSSKIKLRLEDIHEDGLRGPADGLTSVAYEFCVPAEEKVYAEVKRIDPSVGFMPGSRGHIGCQPGATLSIGHTSQPHWREIIFALAALEYIHEIRECTFE